MPFPAPVQECSRGRPIAEPPMRVRQNDPPRQRRFQPENRLSGAAATLRAWTPGTEHPLRTGDPEGRLGGDRGWHHSPAAHPEAGIPAARHCG